MPNKQEKHIFAFYKENLNQVIDKRGSFCEKDPLLWNRLIKVLRLQDGDTFTLFDKTIHATFLLSKKTYETPRVIHAELLKKKKSTNIKPLITLYLPLLKRDAFEYSFYIAAQMGVTTIIPIKTKKAQTTISQKELNRVKKIMIAACEQSKNFAIPEIKEPKTLSKLKQNTNTQKICFDEHGTHIKEISSTLTQGPLNITLGPEGGFTKEEKNILEEKGYSFYKLTPTILRSREALAVGIGIIRSFTS